MTTSSTTSAAASERPDDLSTAQLVSRITSQTSELVRDELKLATAELKQSAKHAGIGVGLFGGAGVLSLYGGGAAVAAAILALALVLPGWAAALIVAGALFTVAAIAGLIGKKQVTDATPPVPATSRNVQLDVATVQEARSHDH